MYIELIKHWNTIVISMLWTYFIPGIYVITGGWLFSPIKLTVIQPKVCRFSDSAIMQTFLAAKSVSESKSNIMELNIVDTNNVAFVSWDVGVRTFPR